MKWFEVAQITVGLIAMVAVYVVLEAGVAALLAYLINGTEASK